MRPARPPMPPILLLAAVLLTACRTSSPEPVPATADQPRPLDAAALRQTLVAHTLTRSGGPFWRPWDYAGLRKSDGTMAAKINWRGGEDRATGTWEISPKGHYCRTWSNDWADGKPGCFRVTRHGTTLIFDHESGARGDADRYRSRLVPGSARGP